MCGLVAMVSKKEIGFAQQEVTAFTQMLFVDQLRGKDGTGIYYNGTKGEFNPMAIKSASPSSVFIGTKEYSAAMETVFRNSGYVVGHNRAGTRGAKDDKNAHPFREGHIMLVHNGTLSEHKSLHETYESDSKAICYSIAKKGAEGTLKEIKGSFALIWANCKEKTLNFCRNSQRPLYLFETKDSFFFSSEEGLAQWILKRNDIKIENSRLLDEGKLFSISFGNTKIIAEKDIELFKWHEQYNNNVAPMWPYSKNQGDIKEREFSKPRFSYNNTIKFRGGQCYPHKNRWVLEGDILINQGLAESITRTVLDFEDEFRVKVYGSREELAPFIQNNTLIGTVSSPTNHGHTDMNYAVHLASIRDYSKTKKTVGGNLIECDFCQTPTKIEELEVVEGCPMCNKCARDIMYSPHRH